MPLQEALKDVKQRMGDEGRDIYISGKNAEGVYQYLKRHYFSSMDIVELEQDENTPGSAGKDAVIVLRTGDYGKVRPLEGKHRLVVIDPEEAMQLPGLDRFYGMSAPFYVEGVRKRDLDTAISDATAGLYLNVFDAFVNYRDGEETPYFRTAELIEYDRSRAILTGLLQSALMKFPLKDVSGRKGVLASREVTGTEGKDDVRMYELAVVLADKTGMEPVKIEEKTVDDPSWFGDHVIRRNLKKRNVLVLDDVLWTGKTVESLETAVKKANGSHVQTVVLMNRSGRAIANVYGLTTMERFMELKKEREDADGS